MKTTNHQLIEDLIDRTKDVINRVQALHDLTDQQLNWKANEES